MSLAEERYLKLAAEARKHIREVRVRDLPALLRSSHPPVLIDVRETEEFAAGAIPGAIHVSRGLLEQQIGEVAPELDTPILCYCAGGNRSAFAVENLQRMGYTSAASLAEGFKGWNAAQSGSAAP